MEGGGENAIVNLEFSGRSRVAIKLDTQWNHERFHKTHVCPDLLVGWEWGSRFVIGCFCIGEIFGIFRVFLGL